MSAIAYGLCLIWIGVMIGFFYRELFRVAGPTCLALAALTFTPSPAKTECLASAEAVWQAHPGSRATWRSIDHHRCWMPRESRGKRHEAKSPPLPRERPAKFARATVRPDARSLSTGAVSWEPSTSPWRADDAFSRVTWPAGAWKEAGR